MRLPSRTGTGILIVAIVAAGARAADPNDCWRNDFARAQAEATRLGRPMLLHFYADWCGPCRTMDRDILGTAELRAIVNGGFVAVKVNIDHQPQVKERFRVDALPTDIIIGPDGRELSRTVGFQQPHDYFANLNRIDAGFKAQRAQRQQAIAAAPVPAAPPVKPPEPARMPELVAPKPLAPAIAAATVDTPTPVKLPPVPNDEPIAVASTSTAPSNPPPAVAETKPAPAAVANELGLDGFCPVTLFNTRSWKAGDKTIAYEHQGYTFFFSGEKQLEAFKAEPGKFAPRLLGCDPVVLSEQNLAVPGTTKYGAYFDGELYLFENSENRTNFRSNPLRYTRTKHVLKPEDVKRRRV